MTIRNKRILVSASAAAVVLFLALWAFWPRPMPVDLATVHQGPLIVTLDEEGETRVRERFVVSAPVAGRALRIELEPGDRVHGGDTVLAVFQPLESVLLDARGRAEAEARVKAAEADLEGARHQRARARAERDFARVECERIRRLAADEVVSVERLDAAELAERQAEEAVEEAEHAVESASYRLVSERARLLELGSPGRRGDDPIVLRSPIDGTVLRRLRESEGVVRAGEALIELGDAADLEVVADFLSSDAVRIRPGARVMIERWGGQPALEGVVERVEPSGFTKISALGVEEQRVNVIIELHDSDVTRHGLGDGYRVEVRVVVWSGDDVLQVPAGSLFRQREEWAVYRIEDGRARLHEITVGARAAASVEVRAGLAEGDLVVLHPGDALREGMRVAQRNP